MKEYMEPKKRGTNSPDRIVDSSKPLCYCETDNVKRAQNNFHIKPIYKDFRFKTCGKALIITFTVFV